MTTVYGVTRFGARLQIAKQLKDITEFPKESVWSASSYLTCKQYNVWTIILITSAGIILILGPHMFRIWSLVLSKE
ncbi:hypothetical protein NQ314_003790 [Rhamnusium bicolor]|uniref:DNA-directed RNA polymerase C-terminal domain-containing protein n=1 Tax=Rhamnusium bicolor TaxID=1586634 RepID=A0AAV8ZL87_9CUCU|nr:hypothetical protein NQ314_003790 [Rhamnusium bicolor]